jgi:hypothetical protein
MILQPNMYVNRCIKGFDSIDSLVVLGRVNADRCCIRVLSKVIEKRERPLLFFGAHHTSRPLEKALPQ